MITKEKQLSVDKKNFELDPADREWEYDGDGTKIYKLDARFPTKTLYKETDLDGGVPYKKGNDDGLVE